MYQINNGVYVYYADFLPSINDSVSLQFKTKWSGANDPDELQNKFQIILTKQEMINLGKQLIEQGSK